MPPDTTSPLFSIASPNDATRKIASLASSFPPIRPLDPNGIDVPAEIPRMRQAFAATNNGRNFRGTEEAGYGIFPAGNGFGHTGFEIGPESHLSVRVPKTGLAIVHTHPTTGDPRPSANDLNSPLPNYVYSGERLYATVPGTNDYHEYNIRDWNLGSGEPQGLQKISRKR